MLFLTSLFTINGGDLLCICYRVSLLVQCLDPAWCNFPFHLKVCLCRGSCGSNCVDLHVVHINLPQKFLKIMTV